MTLLDAHRSFLDRAQAVLADDDRVLAIVLTGSAGRGEQDEWSDLDIGVMSSEANATVLATPTEAERLGDLAIWVDCSFNAPIGGTMAFSRYLVPEGLVLVDWHIWPSGAGRATSGSQVLWTRAGFDLEPFDGTLVDWVGSQSRRSPPPYSRQQRAEWELCMAHIATSRPARGQDATSMLQLMGVTAEFGTEPETQLDAIAAHVAGLEQWVAPRVFGPTLGRIEAARNSL